MRLFGPKRDEAVKAKDKAWGERRYSSYLFLTSALEGGEWLASCPESIKRLKKMTQ
jgi:hypothetical protein